MTNAMTGEYAVLDAAATPDHPAVESWHDSRESAIRRASDLGGNFRAVESSVNGIWHSLTGESLYV